MEKQVGGRLPGVALLGIAAAAFALFAFVQPHTANARQGNQDHDVLGDVCDADLDGDGITNTSDNCPNSPNPRQSDWDHDAVGDNCDPDGPLPPVENCTASKSCNVATQKVRSVEGANAMRESMVFELKAHTPQSNASPGIAAISLLLVAGLLLAMAIRRHQKE